MLLRVCASHTRSIHVESTRTNATMEIAQGDGGPLQNVERVVSESTISPTKKTSTLQQRPITSREMKRKSGKRSTRTDPWSPYSMSTRTLNPTNKESMWFHKWGKLMGLHAVKVIGWGTENGTDYWLIANSWNTDWGEDDNFRIVRRTNECGIESQMVGGAMRVLNARL
ncbi:papain family cysteine protease [Ancylostoma duodenale]|uniref:Papain family cysteine protease n=1 Tax=Ancylostoma duodenale TaxID=51022 RepID=A0A0C2GBV4_9BILA|nr:papain family cysteine protease [Ancylostoma duodenale]